MRKFQDERGIFLTEAVVSICILTIVIGIAFPILMQTYRERQILKQKNEALIYLRHQLLLWKTDGDILSKAEPATVFQLEWIEQTDHSAYLRVYWNYDGRTHYLTGEAKK